jgi:hypothetical protein
MILRALVPAGWMPATGGGTTLTICTGSGLAQIHLDGQGKPVKGDASHKSQDICPFAAVAHLAPPMPVAVLDVRSLLTTRARPYRAADQFRSPPLLDAASPRGPPLSA